MARSKNNPFLRGASGQLGRAFVVKSYKDGRQVLANVPTSRKKTSAKQKANEDRFADANSYAKFQMKKPEVAKLYNRRAKGTSRNGYNLAVRDYSHAPKIESIEADEYSGKPGALIRIRATDDFKVISVKVKITLGKKVIEKGEAIPRGKRGLWRYTTTAKNAKVKGSVITAEATDMPGNTTMAYYTCSSGVVTWI